MNAVLEAREPSARYLAALEPPLLQQFDLIATAPKGVARLRELILTLAVQGKLVPQDPNDEPASVLLERIRGEKARLIQNGKIRKGKSLPDISEEEGLFELPISWKWARLGDLGDWGAGTTPSRNNGEYYGGNIPWFKSGELTADFISGAEEHVTPLALKECSLRENRAGDVLIAMYGATIGKASILSRPAATNQAVCACTPYSGLNNRYLLLLLKALKPYFVSIGAGGAQPNISREKIIATVIGLPPLAEQSRIVARVEELMTLCDALEAKGKLEAEQHARLVGSLFDPLTNSESPHALAENWQRIATHFDLLLDRPAAVDALEQTILQLAVRGLLVPQDPADEPASALLKKIRQEKDHQIAAGKIKRDKPLPPISDVEKPFELPEGWEWARMPDIAQSRLGKMLDAAKNSGTAYPYLRNTNLQWRRFDLSDIKKIYLEPYELAEYRLLPRDLLICEGGEPGRCAVWMDADTEMYFQKALHRVRPFAGVSSEYLATALEANVRAGRMDELFTGATIKHFTGQALERYIFAIPPLAEQFRIVARVTELRALCTQLRDRLATSARTQSRLAEALIEKAVT